MNQVMERVYRLSTKDGEGRTHHKLVEFLSVSDGQALIRTRDGWVEHAPIDKIETTVFTNKVPGPTQKLSDFLIEKEKEQAKKSFAEYF